MPLGHPFEQSFCSQTGIFSETMELGLPPLSCNGRHEISWEDNQSMEKWFLGPNSERRCLDTMGQSPALTDDKHCFPNHNSGPLSIKHYLTQGPAIL